MPDEKTPFIGSHAVCLTGCSDAEEMFRFVNSWGEDWGEAGFGKLPYEYFDRWMLDVYVVDSRPFELPLTTAVPIADLKWGGHDFAERPFHVHELRDTTSDERIAWAFAMPSDDFLDVEEIFVRPQFRHRGYGTHLLRSLHSISRTAGLHLRVFIPFADCEDNNLKAVERLLAKEGYFLIASDVRWVPYTAMRKPEFVRIPPPPALVRRCDGDMLAAAVLQVDQSTAGNKTILPEAAEVVCANELHYRRLTPTGNSTHNTSDDSWLVILGDWSSRPREELISRIAAIFQQRDELAAVPIVLVVDDLGKSDADHQALLIALTEAGANILAPHSQEEADTIMKDPVAFAASELAVVMRSHSVSATTRSPSDPNSPDAFKEFAKAVTRLSPADLKEIINGQRTDDWRYSG